MSGYLFLVPVSLALGLIGLAAFLWSLRHEQYDDLDGAAERVLFAEDRPLVDRSTAGERARSDEGITVAEKIGDEGSGGRDDGRDVEPDTS